MRSSQQVQTRVTLPDPGQARTLDELIERLRSLKIWAGDPSYEVIKNQINAAWTDAGRPAGELTKKTTVVDCFRTGRRRVNVDLVIAVVRALHPDAGYVAQWHQALRVVLTETRAAAQVRAQDTLPEDLAEFTGRSSEIDRLRQLPTHGAGSGAAVVIAAIEGMAGVGKTRLAVHAGHLLAGEQPFDQTLFANLRGFHPDPAQPPADPAAVLDSFLRLLGVPGHQIPHDLSARTGLYRQRLAGMRALVVLDNAADEQQVEPLLPGSPGGLTLITSRRSLAGLRMATHLPVDVFTPDEAHDFLTRAVPGIPAGDDPTAAARVAQRCGYLPLALGLVAAHMRAKPRWTLTDHADRLDERHHDRRLDDGVELALSLSYQHLPPDRRRLFRLLALHPGNDIDLYAAAALAQLDLDTAHEHLRQLTADHLLQQATAGRFAFHDLVRAYAAGRTVDEDRPPDRRAALTRLFDHYLHTTAAAMDTLYPAEGHHRPRIPAPTTHTPPLSDPTAARHWLDTERVNLIATAGHTTAPHWPSHIIQLTATVLRYLSNNGHHSDAITLHTRAHEAAKHTGDRAAEAYALANLATGYWRQSRLAQATEHARQALTVFREIANPVGEGHTLINLCRIYWQQGHYRQAADHAQRALMLFRDTGDRFGEARALATLGLLYRRMGRYRQASEQAQQALIVLRGAGDRPGEAFALGALSLVHERQGRDQQAVDQLQQVLTVFREVGNRSAEGFTLTNLGIIHLKLGRRGQAVEHHRQAITLFRDLGDLCGEAEALNGLGEVLLADGQADQARTHHTGALTLARAVGDRYEHARAHNGIAHTHHTTGEADHARRHWQHALAIYTDLDVPEADQVRTHLANLGKGQLETAT